MTSSRPAALVAMIGLLATASAQSKLDTSSGTNTLAAPSEDPAQSTSDAQKKTSPNLSPEKDWPNPVNDEHQFTYLLLDVFEYRPKGPDSDFRWDAQGWRGGDYNRIWFKSEGQRNTALKANYDTDLQLLYGRFVRRYYDFQLGVRAEAQNFRGANVIRGHAVIGLEGLVPYNYEIEPALFISQNGDVSARLTATKDLLLTQRLVIQPRIEINAAIQRVERFTTGRGLNNIELGFRLRYEIRR
ncbi:MAG: copper resistance protein, partial [Bryobacterales bacterium]|nr:copper resistance protein [Bryobacterales bacterium]